MTKREGPFNGELNPSKSFLSHAKNRDQPRKQYDGLVRVAEGLRKIGAHITGQRCNGAEAHAILDDLIRTARNGQTRVADIHIRDIGANHKLAIVFENAGMFTVSDLANSCATKLPAHLDVLDALTMALTALRRVLDLEREMQGG